MSFEEAFGSDDVTISEDLAELIFETIIPERRDVELKKVSDYLESQGKNFADALEVYGEVPGFLANLELISYRGMIILARGGFPDVIKGDLWIYSTFSNKNISSVEDVKFLERLVRLAKELRMDLAHKNSDGHTLMSKSVEQRSKEKIVILMSAGVNPRENSMYEDSSLIDEVSYLSDVESVPELLVVDYYNFCGFVSS